MKNQSKISVMRTSYSFQNINDVKYTMSIHYLGGKMDDAQTQNNNCLEVLLKEKYNINFEEFKNAFPESFI
jgi:hypothetical protein